MFLLATAVEGGRERRARRHSPLSQFVAPSTVARRRRRGTSTGGGGGGGGGGSAPVTFPSMPAGERKSWWQQHTRTRNATDDVPVYAPYEQDEQEAEEIVPGHPEYEMEVDPEDDVIDVEVEADVEGIVVSSGAITVEVE